AEIKTDDLDTLLEAIYIVYGSGINYLFFDEIQNADAWPLFVNRLLRQQKHIFLTGSNSKLLSNELMTHLTGRHNTVSLYPFSFMEYCQIMGVDITGVTTKASAQRAEHLHKYLSKGGMPELINEKNSRKYVTSLLNTIIRNDIAKRFRINNIDALHKMAIYLVDNYGQEFVASKVSELFGITNKTASNYFHYLKEAFLLIGVPKFSFKAQERVRNEKCYVVDIAFPEEHDKRFSLENLGWKLENVVCVELLRRYKNRGSDIFYYKDNVFECDFIIADGTRIEELIQVCYDISSPKTRKREINGLKKAADKFHCNKLTLITFASEESVREGGYTIDIIGAVDWLLKRRKI
ncbi:MAG: ATP-binding protein, partial [Bacteroidia bacterium]|nr:ATP-binding protein [Bacteroidia bacterium]